MVKVNTNPSDGDASARKLFNVGECHVFEAPSKSRPGHSHFVFVFKDNRGIRCTCEGWKFNSKCWHIENLPLCRELNPQAKGFYIPECSFIEKHEGRHSWDN